jgi:SAM-dependent methyltransferase
MSEFKANYAHLYDRFHASKNYELEAKKLLDFIQSINRDYEVTSILDMGCGTGAHLEAFANLGKQVAGYDISESMIQVARDRVPNADLFTNLPINSLLVDLSYAFFDVISYVTSEEDLQIFFKHAYTHTRNGGYFFADSWNYAGIILDPPKVNTRQVQDGTSCIERSVVPVIENENQEQFLNQGIVELKIVLRDLGTNQPIVQEIHKLRGWKPEVVSRMLELAGFKDVRVFSVKDYSQVLEDHEFRFGVIARKENR